MTEHEYLSEVQRLEKSYELLALENKNLQAKLDLELKRKAVEDKNLEISANLTLKLDWLESAKTLQSLKDNPDKELSQALCIDFANKLRVGALKELDADTDDILVLKATAYEVFYRASVACLENRNLKVKLAARDKFADDVRKENEVKHEKQRIRTEQENARERSKDPKEQMILNMMKFGMSREDAEKQVENVLNAGKALTK